MIHRLLPADGHGKLIAAHTGQQTVARHPLLQLPRNMGNKRVADLMPVVVVDILKPVEINKHHALGLMLRLIALLIQPPDQRPAVGQLAEPVG